MVATVYERENCASNPGHLGECRSLTFAPPKNTEKKKSRIERTNEILWFENVFEREKAQFYRLPGFYHNNFFFHVLRSVWYDTERFPSSWRLDPTEGPDRVRCRLQRFHLDVDKKYVMEEYREKSEFIIVLKYHVNPSSRANGDPVRTH